MSGIHAVIHGRLGRDPETKQVGGDTVLKLNVAADHGWGEKKTTTWVSVDVWGKRGQGIAPHLKKGSEVVIRGEIYTREWTDKDGGKRTSVECRADDVSFAGGKGKAEGSSGGSGGGSDYGGGGGYGGGQSGGSPGNNDDIPFARGVEPWDRE